jgi:PAS domain S-box-containing protein
MPRMADLPASGKALLAQPALFDSHPQPMWVVDVSTLAFVAVNAAATRLYGYSKDQFLAMTADQIRPAEDVDDLRRVFAEWSNNVSQRIWRHRKKSGEVITVRVTSFSVEFASRRARLAMIEELGGGPIAGE